MKKKVISVLLIGAMVASMAACGGKDQGNQPAAGGSAPAEGGTQSEAPTTSEGGGNTLSVYAWDKGFNIPALEAAAAEYKKENPDFNLEIIEQSGSTDVETAVKTAASAGNYETLPDIVLFQDHAIQKYVADYPDAWVPVGNDCGIVWDDFAAEKLDYSTINGEHYGVPVDNGTVICAYRIDLLQEAGYTIDDVTGISWDQFLEIGRKVQEKTGKYMMCMNADGNDYMYMMMQAEGLSQFKDGKPNFSENEALVKIINVITTAVQDKVMYLANSWSDYTDQVIGGDMVAGVMNGNWIIPTIEKVEANSGKWEITTMPTLDGGKEGYASNGGSSLYITANCKNVDLAKDFLTKTFGGSTAVYDQALTNGGVISTYAPAGESEVYQQGVAFFNDQPIYSKIVEWGTKVPIVEQSDFHYPAREQLGVAIQQILDGTDPAQAIKDAEDNVNFAMGN